jgi:hypothetical protein
VVHYQGRFDFFIASDGADVRGKVLMDHETWAYRFGTGPKMLDERMSCGIMTDPPDHHAFATSFSAASARRIWRGFR